MKIISDLYKMMPKYMQPVFWFVLSIATIIFIVIFISAYRTHEKACNENKQDEFFWLKCYAKPDSVEVIKIEYRDTCNNIPAKIEKEVNQSGNNNTQNVKM